MMTSASVLQLIGKHVRVINPVNDYGDGLNGQVIDETKNTLVISSGSPKRLLKNGIIIEVEGKTVKGTDLKGRSYERFKR